MSIVAGYAPQCNKCSNIGHFEDTLRNAEKRAIKEGWVIKHLGGTSYNYYCSKCKEKKEGQI